jgi:hypothetical protein
LAVIVPIIAGIFLTAAYRQTLTSRIALSVRRIVAPMVRDVMEMHQKTYHGE